MLVKMRLRSGKHLQRVEKIPIKQKVKLDNLSVYWWYPFTKEQCLHSGEIGVCYCANNKTIEEWLTEEYKKYGIE